MTDSVYFTELKGLVYNYDIGDPNVPVSHRVANITGTFNGMIDDLHVMKAATYVDSSFKRMAIILGSPKEKKSNAQHHTIMNLNQLVQEVTHLPLETKKELAGKLLQRLTEAKKYYDLICQADPEYAAAEENPQRSPAMVKFEELEKLLED